MEKTFGEVEFRSEFFHDLQQGSIGFKLFQHFAGVVKHVASVTYWEGDGHFYIETFESDIPVEVAEWLIAEAKDRVKLK